MTTDRSSSKNVTDQQVADHMAPHLRRFETSFVRREPTAKQSNDAKSESIGAPVKKTRSSGQQEILNDDQRAYLQSILDHPNTIITHRAEDLGLTPSKSNRIKRDLIDRELIFQFQLNLGRITRGTVGMLVLTNAGYKSLGKRVRTKKPDNVSHQHWWWCRNVAWDYQVRGYAVELEHTVNGKRCDVFATKNNHSICVECELNPQNCLQAKDALESGCDEVVVAARDAPTLKAIKRILLPHLTEDQKLRATLMLLTDFGFAQRLTKRYAL